jgi:hypothetical protein
MSALGGAAVLAIGLPFLIPATAGSPAAPSPALEGVPAFGHVFLIIGENTSLSEDTAANTPYLVKTLKPRAAWLTGYTALADGSLADYIGLTSGQYRRCDVNDALPYNPSTNKPTCAQPVDNLFHQLDKTRVSWTEWNESMANPCAFFDGGTDWAYNVYSTHHNPAVYYTNIEGGRYAEDFTLAPNPECIKRVIATGTTGPNDMSAFNAALARGAAARFNMIIPNDCENGHDPCGTSNPFGQFDAFLAREVPRIEASPAFGANGLILITYDEWDDTLGTNPHVAFAAIGPQVQPGSYGGQYNHYSTLRTLEDGFGISSHLAGAATASPINTIWKKTR